MTRAISLVEVEPFSRQAASFLSSDEISDLKWYLAMNPTAGSVIPGSGGIRKLRWSAQGKGTRGGSRIIYYFHDDSLPIWLLAAYPKSAKTDLSEREKSVVRKLVSILINDYRKRS